MFAIQYAFQFLMIGVDRCGSLWIVVDRCGSLWIVVGRCGSLWVVPGFSNYAWEGPEGVRLIEVSLYLYTFHSNSHLGEPPLAKKGHSQFFTYYRIYSIKPSRTANKPSPCRRS